MINCWGMLFHIDEYFTVKKMSLAGVFVTRKLTMNSVFIRQYGVGFQREVLRGN